MGEYGFKQRGTKHFGNVITALISGPFVDELNIPFPRRRPRFTFSARHTEISASVVEFVRFSDNAVLIAKNYAILVNFGNCDEVFSRLQTVRSVVRE